MDYPSGKKRGRPFNRVVSFEEARDFVRSLGLESPKAWFEWSKAGNRPAGIPSRPMMHYPDQWKGWGDWLRANNLRSSPSVREVSFYRARDFARSLGLKSSVEWFEWSAEGRRPAGIPSHPERLYKDQWQGWRNWLGMEAKDGKCWNASRVLDFLRDLKARLPDLSPMVLFEILRNNGILDSAGNQKNGQHSILSGLVRLSTLGDKEAMIAHVDSAILALESPGGDSDSFDTLGQDESGIEAKVETDHREGQALDSALPALSASSVLRAVDFAAQQGACDDEGSIEFIIADGIGQLWRSMLQGTLEMEDLMGQDAGNYATTVRDSFLSQLEGAQSLVVPEGYSFHTNGSVLRPNLMQSLVAYRLQTEKRLGNWSGTGAGKTLSAVLASRVIDAHLTLVVAPNNVLSGWADVITNAFPNSSVIVKDRGIIKVDVEAHTYVLLNYESFQLTHSEEMVGRLVDDHTIDFVVLDEIQMAKQRGDTASIRRRVLVGLLEAAERKNPDLHVLGMSATPVINNLAEGKSLLEMVLGVELPELSSRADVRNVVALHKELVVHGVRYRPEYSQVLEECPLGIQGDYLLDDLRALREGDILGLERSLLGAKLSSIVSQARTGTLVYTQYVDGIVPMLRESLEEAGFRVGMFTGDDKSGLEPFKRGEVDVLIGSSAIGLGVDGLQKSCNHLIVASLPWTGASYEQLVGRVFRQGSDFSHVSVVIPQVTVQTDEGEWSWDVQRHDRIKYKKTLGDAALDGVIPEGVLESESSLLRRAMAGLHRWIERLEREEDGGE